MAVQRKRSFGLKRICARYWALLYLALIPIYAAIYYFLIPNHFYHSTVQYEQSFNQDASNILKGLKDEITNNFREKHKSDIATIYGYNIHIGSLKIRELNIKEDEVSFSLGFNIGRPDAGGHLSPIVKYSLKDREELLELAKGEWIHNKFLTTEELEVPLPQLPDNANMYDLLRTIIPRDYAKDVVPDVVMMPISSKLDSEIRNYASGTRGFPAKSSGHFMRLLYLSAITITTVGYGDILPITTTARALVSSEAILGIIIIGLFLNSLWYERTKVEDNDAS